MGKDTRWKHAVERWPNTGRIKHVKRPAELPIGVQERIDRYGGTPAETCDAAGRARLHSHPGDFTKAMLRTARDHYRRYWQFYGNFSSGDSVARLEDGGRGQKTPRMLSQQNDPDPNYDPREAWLRAADAAVKSVDGGRADRYYRELVLSSNHADAGPSWLDRIIDAQRSGRRPIPIDKYKLSLAVAALRAVDAAISSMRDAA